MKQFRLKLFGWYINVSRKRSLDKVSKCRGGIARRMRNLRNRRYQQKNGCCEQCGQHYEKHELQMHHILPFADFPDLSCKGWNLLMLCPHCHYVMHKNLLLQMETMQAVATQNGIDLRSGFNMASERRWNKHHINISNQETTQI